MRRGALTALAVVLLSGCALSSSAPLRVPMREATPEEARLVSEALSPLLRTLNDPALHSPGCRMGLAVARSPRINASVGRAKNEPCPRVAIVLTEGALRRLPVDMLRAVLAHELGHVVLNHAGRNTQADELAADEFAAGLLKRLEPRHPDACLQLVYVFAVLAEPDGGGWFATHPSPDRRAERALARCNE